MKSIISDLPEGTKLKGSKFNYQIEGTIGQGTFGITYLAKVILDGEFGSLDSNMKVAIKEFFMKEVNSRTDTSVVLGAQSKTFQDYRSRFQKEAFNLSRMKHPGIVKVLEAFEDNGTSYFVMEYLNGGSMKEHIDRNGKMLESDALKYIIKVGEALSFMHSHKMLHLDFKPDNIVFRDAETPVLVDFGLSKAFDENGIPESSTAIGLGTPGFSPIEQLYYSREKGIAPTLDIYALGGTLFNLVTGVRPPNASAVNDDDDLLPKLMNQKGVSQDVIDLIIWAMQPRKKDRPQSVSDFIAKINVIRPSLLKSNETQKTNKGVANSPKQQVSSLKPSQYSIQTDEETILDETEEETPIHRNQSKKEKYSGTKKQELGKKNSNEEEETIVVSDINNNSKKGPKKDDNSQKVTINGILEGVKDYKVSKATGAKEEKEKTPKGHTNKQNNNSSKLNQTKENRKAYLYKGRIIHSDEIFSFYGQYCRIQDAQTKKYGFIDKNMNEIIPCEYDEMEEYLFDGLCMAVKNNKWGCVNKYNEIIIPLINQKTENCKFLPFKNGIAKIKDSYINVNNKTLSIFFPGFTAFMTIVSLIAIGMTIHLYLNFSESFFNYIIIGLLTGASFVLSLVALLFLSDLKSPRYRTCDIFAEDILKKYEDHAYLATGGLLPIKKNGLWGFINKKGEEIIKPSYDWVSNFIKNEAWAIKNKKLMKINKKGITRNLSFEEKTQWETMWKHTFDIDWNK